MSVSDTSRDAIWRDITDPRRAVELEDLEAGLKAPVFENIELPEEFGPVSVRIDDHKIKRYAFSQDDHLDWAIRGDSPFGGRIGHAALLANDILQLFTLKYAASAVVGLHIEEQLWFDSPVHLDEVATMHARYVDAYTQRGQGCVVMEGEAIGADGRSLIRHRGIEILRTVPGDIVGRAGSTESRRRVTGEVPADARRSVRLHDDVRVGDALQPLHKTITVEQAAVFSRIGEYVRTTHNSLEVAREAGLRVPIVQGQQLVGVLAQLLTSAFSEGFLTSGWLRVKFIAPVFVHDELTVEGIVTAVEPTADGAAVELEIWIRRPDGRLAVAGWASATLPRPSAS
jgi:acyl dehydratase